MYAGFKKFARKKTDNLFGNDKKKAAGKAEHLNDKAPKNVVKHTDPPKGPVKNMEKPAPGKQKPTEINSKAPANAPDTDVPNAPATKHTPEMKNTDPAPSNTNVEKLEKDIHPENSPVNKADAPKDQKVANGEKEPQSAVLNDDPNIEESNLKDLKKYEDDVDPSTKKKMKDKADGEVEKGPNHNSKTKALVMARIIAETNDKADTPVPVLMGELAALKAMKGVTGFDYKNGNAPGEFRILMYGSEYTVDPSYKVEVTEAGGSKDNWNHKLNGELTPNTRYNVDGYIYETDDLGRVSKVEGELTLKDRGRNEYQQQKSVPLKEGVQGEDDGGHLIAQIFNGPGEQINYLPMVKSSNRYGEWRAMEREWQRNLKAVPPKKVTVEINPIFEGSSKRPKSFQVKYKINGEATLIDIPN